MSGWHVLVVWCLDLSESVIALWLLDSIVSGGVVFGVGVVCSVPGWT